MSDIGHFVGIDPGASTCLAMVRSDGRNRPVLRGLLQVFGADHLWFPRLDQAVAIIAATCEGGGTPTCWLEDWAPKAKGERKVTRASAWIGLGRRQGNCEHAWWSTFGELPARVPVATEQVSGGRLGWASILHLPHGKADHDKGMHRVREAILHVEGARDALMAIHNQGRQVDAAEACLIAAAAAMHARTQRVTR